MSAYQALLEGAYAKDEQMKSVWRIVVGIASGWIELLGSVALAGAVLGACGGGSAGGVGGAAGNFYSCDDVSTSTADNGDVTVMHYCEEFTIDVDPSGLMVAAEALKQSCDETLGYHYKVATFSSAPCSRDDSLIATCDDPTSSPSDMGKQYAYFNKLNGVVQVIPVTVAANCTQVHQ